MNRIKVIIKSGAMVVLGAACVILTNGCSDQGTEVSNSSAESVTSEDASINQNELTETDSSLFSYGWDSDKVGYEVCDYLGDETVNIYNLPSESDDGHIVTEVGGGIFYCNEYVVEVNIPNTVTTLPQTGFYNAVNLETVTFEEGCTVEKIPADIFMNCTSLKNINLPNGIKTIYYGAFQDCSSLECITIPDGVTVIDEIAFANCTSLKEIHMTDSVTEFGSPNDPFEGVPDDFTIYAPSGSYAEEYAESMGYNFIAEE